jgi:hypothetical protein
LTQGLCIPPCALPSDCAPSLTPAIAATLYSCVDGSCSLHCANDLTCGQGLVCKSGLCAVADCKTMSDCPAGQYCTSATYGRCAPFQTCAQTPECPANFECRPFATGQCPPGFSCTTSVCQELPTCLIDADCLPGGKPQPGKAPAYCQEGHCQETTQCAGPAGCGALKACVAGLCVPGVCRGLTDCPAGQACVDGACGAAPDAADIAQLKLSPTKAVLAIGDTLKFTLIAYRLDGSSFPLPQGAFSVVDELGLSTSAATIDSAGTLTAAAAGKVVVRAQVTGAPIPAREAPVTIAAALTSGRRVLVVAQADGAPLSGVQVRGCEGAALDAPCATFTDVSTGADGQALFPSFGAGLATFTAVSPAVRADGLPSFDRASVVATLAADVFLPLGDNPVQAAAGYTAAIQFSEVHSSGQYWAGFAALSAGDLPDLELSTLLGETFQVALPGVGQTVPVPGSVVLYTSPGFGIPQQVKAKSFGLGQAGVRSAVAFAGRAELNQALSMRSLDFLAYAGAMDYALQPAVTVESRPRVPDTADLNNNGLCASPTKCPSGSENVPDYATFPALSFSPRRQQNRRTEVVLPSVPTTLDTVVVAAVEVSFEGGVFPLGFSSSTAGAPQNGGRAVPAVTLRSGAPYGGTEVATPGIWALATSAASMGGTAGGSATARLTHGAVLPTRVVVKPFLPITARSAYSPLTRIFTPGQPDWNAAASAGAGLAKVVLSGTGSRHVVYFEMSGSQTAVRVPEGPAGSGVDPATQGAVALQVVALELTAGTTATEVFTLRGPNLWQLANYLDGYSRFQP